MGNQVSSDEEVEKTAEKSDAQGKNVADLTDLQIRMVRQVWTRAHQNTVEPGLSILEAAFDTTPEIRTTVFIFDKDPAIAAKQIREHAERINGVLEQVIALLNDEDELHKLLFDLGRRHFHKAKADGFQPRYWDTFAEAMISRTVEWGSKSQRNEKTQEAWTKIVLYIIDKMKDGYYHERKANSQIRRSVRCSHSNPLPKAGTS